MGKSVLPTSTKGRDNIKDIDYVYKILYNTHGGDKR
jgi:hypothetical protein